MAGGYILDISYIYCRYIYLITDEVDLEDLLAALSPEEVSHLVDEMAADPDDKHMPASARCVAPRVPGSRVTCRVLQDRLPL